MPDLDQIKQEEQGVTGPARAVRQGWSGNPAGRPRGLLRPRQPRCPLLLAGAGEALTRKAVELALTRRHCGCRDLQRAGPAVIPLFLAPRRRRNSRISAEKAMSLADNFLQEQQKQRECRFKKGRGGNPLGGPRGSRNRWARAAGLAPFCAAK